MPKELEIKMRGRLGPEDSDDKVIRILNRLVEWHEGGITYEADPRHVEVIIKQLNLGDSKPVITLARKKKAERRMAIVRLLATTRNWTITNMQYSGPSWRERTTSHQIDQTSLLQWRNWCAA